MYVKSVEEKLTSALQANPAVNYGEFAKTLDYQEQRGLLDTVRVMEKSGKLKRDLSEKVDNKAVLRILRVG